MLPIDRILRQSKLINTVNILTFVTHERYEPNLCLSNANFYSLTGKGIRGWNPKVSPIPQNYQIIEVDTSNLDNILGQIPRHIVYDAVLTQNRFGQFQIGQAIANALFLPHVTIEHTDTMPNWPENHIKDLGKLTGDINLFISEYSQERWMADKSKSQVLEHGINTTIFCPAQNRKNQILSMCNDWINRDMPCGFSLWREVTQGLPTRVVGDTPGLSKGSESLEECVSEFQNSKIFLNTSQFSPIPMALLEAMSCGCAVVSSATCMIPEIIEHGVNGFISNDPQVLRLYLQTLLKDDKKCREMGKKARETVQKRFDLTRFTNQWNEVWNKIKYYNK